MTSRALSLLALLVAGAATAHAQQGNSAMDGAAGQNNLQALTQGSATVLPRATSDGTIGSPYADNRWLSAQLRLSNSLPLAPVLLKYDVLDHRLLMRTPARATDSLQLDDSRVVSFVLQEPATVLGPGRQRLFRRFAEAPLPKQRPDYVEVLHEGRYALLLHRTKSLKKADIQGAYSSNNRFDEIEDHVAYYVRTPEATVQPVKLTLKTLQAAMPSLADALKTAAAHSPRTEADWAAVLNAADPAPAK